jgi:hypothetical protein
MQHTAQADWPGNRWFATTRAAADITNVHTLEQHVERWLFLEQQVERWRKQAKMLVLVSPGGFERFTRDLSEPAGTPRSPPDIAKLEAVAANYGVDILGPLPGEAP